MTMHIPIKTTLIALTTLLAACTSDGYQSGDGRYSAMRADFVEAATDGTAAITTISTDDGNTLTLTQTVKTKWAQKADSTYRALAYYNPVATVPGANEAELMALQSVAVPTVKRPNDIENGLKTDPVSLNSVWLSRSGRYLNLDISLKTGRSDDEDATQTIGAALTGKTLNTDGTTTFTLTLHHDQGSVPEYYSTACYVSIPLYRGLLTPAAGDTVAIDITTYKGKTVKTFTIK